MRDFGMLDAFLLATALSRKATVLTGDPHFRRMKGGRVLGVKAATFLTPGA